MKAGPRPRAKGERVSKSTASENGSAPQESAGAPGSTDPVSPGEMREVADGVFLIANPVAFPPGFQNAYLLADETEDGAPGWTLVDPGLSSAEKRVEDILREGFADGPHAERRLSRIIATHHHPDHIGAAAVFMRRYGAPLLTTRTAWLYARMLQLDASDTPTEEAELFYRRAGFDEDQLERWRERSRLNFAAMVSPLPLGFKQLRADDQLTIGGESGAS